jgi:hypothetical protein
MNTGMNFYKRQGAWFPCGPEFKGHIQKAEILHPTTTSLVIGLWPLSTVKIREELLPTAIRKAYND